MAELDVPTAEDVMDLYITWRRMTLLRGSHHQVDAWKAFEAAASTYYEAHKDDPTFCGCGETMTAHERDYVGVCRYCR